MGVALNDLSKEGLSSIYSTTQYMIYISSHLKWLREHPTTIRAVLDKTIVHKNLNDFSGLFMDMGIRYEDHLIVMLVNDCLDPFKLTDEIESLLIPNNQIVDQLKLLFKTTTI